MTKVYQLQTLFLNFILLIVFPLNIVGFGQDKNNLFNKITNFDNFSNRHWENVSSIELNNKIYLPIVLKNPPALIFKDEFLVENNFYVFTSDFQFLNEHLILKSNLSKYNTRAILKPDTFNLTANNYRVETIVKRGDELNTQYGLVFAYDLSQESFYRFMLDPDTCIIYTRYFSLDTGYVDIDDAYGVPVACNPGDQENNISILVKGEQVDIEINHQKITSITIERSIFSGTQVGMMMIAPLSSPSGWSDGSAEAYFDHFLIIYNDLPYE